MMGSAALPIAANIGGNDVWMAGELVSNQSGTAVTPFGNVTVAPGSDVLTLRGFFEIAPMFTDPNSDIDTSKVTVRESNAGRVINTGISQIDIDADGDPEGLKGRGLFFVGKMDQREYAVGQITANASLSGTAPDRVLTIHFGTGTSQWSGLNQTGVTVPPTFDTYRVGILDSYTYYVDPDFTLQRLRADATGATSEPVAINIGSLQVAFGVDANGNNNIDVGEWLSSPSVTDVSDNPVLAMRITVLGRTGREVPDWIEPAATFDVEDMDITDISRFAKWRRIQVEAALRNYLF
jgi:hypothetical protein